MLPAPCCIVTWRIPLSCCYQLTPILSVCCKKSLKNILVCVITPLPSVFSSLSRLSGSSALDSYKPAIPPWCHGIGICYFSLRVVRKHTRSTLLVLLWSEFDHFCCAYCSYFLIITYFLCCLYSFVVCLCCCYAPGCCYWFPCCLFYYVSC